MDCPFCAKHLRDLFGLSLHLEDAHPNDQHRVGVVVMDHHALPVIECDIDSIYQRRPDLVCAQGTGA